MKYFIYIYVLILLILPELLSAQFSISQPAIQVKTAVLDLNFELADSLIQQSVFDIVENEYIKAYGAFVFATVSNRKTAIDSTEKMLSQQLQKIKNSGHGAKSNYFQAELHLMLSIISYQNQAYVKTLTNYLNFQRLRKRNTAMYADFANFRIHELVGIVLVHWVNEMVFNQEVDLQKFWKNDYAGYLHATRNKIAVNSMEYRELALIDGLLQGNFRFFDDADSISHNTILLNGKEGPLEAYAAAVYYKNAGAYKQQWQVLAYADSMHFNAKYNLLNLSYGIALLNKLDAKADLYLKRFIKSNNNEQFTNYAHLKLAWFYSLQGNAVALEQNITSISKNNQLHNAEDNQANYEIKHASNWTQELIKSRLLFDGGAYMESKQVLIKNKTKIANYNQGQKLMYSYQLARAYHKLNNLNAAIPFYEMAINSNLQDQYYYPVYAAYYLGKLHMELQNWDKAREYFSICLRFDSPIYKTEIHAKANKELKKLPF